MRERRTPLQHLLERRKLFFSHPLRPEWAFSADDALQRAGCRMRPGAGLQLRL